MWGDYYPDDDRYAGSRSDAADRYYEFEVTCTSCGASRSNLDGWCSCGASGESYSGADASRWNEHLRRSGR